MSLGYRYGDLTLAFEPSPLIVEGTGSSPPVTKVDFDKWADYLSDCLLAMAFLDRLVEGAIILKLKGKS